MARPAAVVVDASVAVKWFNTESGTREALALRDDHVGSRVVLAAPSLLVWEVGNALRYSQAIGADRVERAIRDLVDLQVILVEPDPEWMQQAAGLAFRRGLTLYDASYLALAQHLRADLYTADERMLEAGQGLAKAISRYGKERR